MSLQMDNIYTAQREYQETLCLREPDGAFLEQSWYQLMHKA